MCVCVSFRPHNRPPLLKRDHFQRDYSDAIKSSFYPVTGRIFIPAKVKDSRAWLRQVLYDPKEPNQTFFYTFSTRNSHLSPGKKVIPRVASQWRETRLVFEKYGHLFFCVRHCVESPREQCCLTLPPVHAYLIRNRRYGTGTKKNKRREI